MINFEVWNERYGKPTVDKEKHSDELKRLSKEDGYMWLPYFSLPLDDTRPDNYQTLCISGEHKGKILGYLNEGDEYTIWIDPPDNYKDNIGRFFEHRDIMKDKEE